MSIKRFGYASLAGALLLATPVLAQMSGNFMTQQSNNQWRASKLAGVDVYSSDNQKVGTIDDVLLSSNGSAAAVVIGSGGVLGVGKKDIAVPFDKVNWSTQGRTIAEGTNTASAVNPGDSATMNQGNSGAAATAAAQGYPDRAILQISKSDFDSAPAFTYAQNTTSSSNSNSSGTTTTQH